MAVYHQHINFTHADKWVFLREIRGVDVLQINQVSTLDAIQLVDNLLVAHSKSKIRPGMAAEIAVADRDELLSEVYKRTYGSRIESTMTCQSCGEAFDLSFEISQLCEFIKQNQGDAKIERQENGAFKLQDGSLFRLPCGADERLIFGLSWEHAEQVLLDRCLLNDEAREKRTDVQSTMDQIAPVYKTDLQTNCPECGHSQSIHFDMQSYLLNTMLLEKAQIPFEVHRLAYSYGWSQQEILDLPRSLRQRYVSLIDAETTLN